MFKSNWKRILLIILGIATAGVFDLLVAIGGPPPAAAGVERELGVPERGAGAGHGSYCVVPEHGVYYLGRDLEDEVNGWIGFARWCEERGGRQGWHE